MNSSCFLPPNSSIIFQSTLKPSSVITEKTAGFLVEGLELGWVSFPPSCTTTTHWGGSSQRTPSSPPLVERSPVSLKKSGSKSGEEVSQSDLNLHEMSKSVETEKFPHEMSKSVETFLKFPHEMTKNVETEKFPNEQKTWGKNPVRTQELLPFPC